METLTATTRYAVDDLPISLEQKKQIKRSIGNYRGSGIDIELTGIDTVKITQSKLTNGYILSNKQLYERAKEVFGDFKIKISPVVFFLKTEEVNIEWIEKKMDEFGIRKNDLIGQLGINKSTLSLYFSGERGLTQTAKASFFYYFLTYQLNRDLRAAM